MASPNSTRNLDEKLQAVLECGLKLVDAHCGSILLLDGDHLVIRTAMPTSLEQMRDAQVPMQDSISGVAALTKTPVLVPTVELEQRMQYKRVLNIEGDTMISEIAVPISNNGQVLGVLNIESPYLHTFTKDSQEFLLALANVAATILKSVQFEEDMDFQKAQ